MSSFSGFQESDFDDVAGSTWRKHLGHVLSKTLQPELGNDAKSWPVGRRQEVHVGKARDYDFKDNHKKFSKLFVYTDHDCLTLGFYVEAPRAKPKWKEFEHWQKFQHRFGQHAGFQRMVLDLMLKHELSCGDYYADNAKKKSALGCRFQVRSGRLQAQLFDHDEWEDATLSSLVSRIVGLKPGPQWINLHLCKSIPRSEALAMGANVVPVITEVLRDLSPVYLLSVA